MPDAAVHDHGEAKPSHVQPISAISRPSVEFNDAEYAREVLQLKAGVTEDVYDDFLTKEAEKLGIIPTRSPTPNQAVYNSMRESALTATTRHARTTSSDSQGTISTGLTSRSSFGDSTPSQAKKRPNARRSLSFSGYESLAVQKMAGFSAMQGAAEPAPSLFSVSTSRSFSSIRSGLKNRFRLRRSKSTQDSFMLVAAIPSSSSANINRNCLRCKGAFKMPTPLHTLPCMHNYCDGCLRFTLSQACTEESKMPPRCCGQPVPTSIIKTVYSREDQHIFMRSVLLFSTPKESRVFCPNVACGEFIPPRDIIDPKRPFDVVCRKCRTAVCSICKEGAHPFAELCPQDREYDSRTQMEGNSPSKRCYNCRDLVDASDGCGCIFCHCNAEFCFTCGAVWDSEIGCPNYCYSEEELERRRIEEEERIAALERERLEREEAERQEAAEKLAAEQRTLESEELKSLRATQITDRDRFCAFEKKMRFMMFTRQGQTRVEALDRHAQLQAKTKEKHTKIAMHLEDRQVAAEMELRATLKQSERSVRIRLRHMEAYCDGLGRAASGSNPARTVTERDLRELGQQYNVKDDLERLHQSKINVMRDKQAKQMEQLLDRQEQELEELAAKHAKELETLEASFEEEATELQNVFSERRSRLSRRWELAEEIERLNLTAKTGLAFAPMAAIEWPEQESKKRKDGLDAMPEIE
jgi:hypothetical protein